MNNIESTTLLLSIRSFTTWLLHNYKALKMLVPGVYERDHSSTKQCRLSTPQQSNISMPFYSMSHRQRITWLGVLSSFHVLLYKQETVRISGLIHLLLYLLFNFSKKKSRYLNFTVLYKIRNLNGIAFRQKWILKLYR